MIATLLQRFRLARVIFIIFLSFGCASSSEMSATGTSKPCTQEHSLQQLKNRADQWLKKMRKGTFRERENASRGLRELVIKSQKRTQLIEYLEERLDELQDVEIHYRLEHIINLYLKPWKLAKILYKLKKHTKAVTSVIFSPDGNSLVSASADKTLRIWDPHTGSCLRAVTSLERRLGSIALSPNGKLLASADGTEVIRVWDSNALKVTGTLKEFREPKNLMDLVAFSPDGKMLVAVGFRGVAMWNPDTGIPLSRIWPNNPGFLAVGFSPDGEKLVSANINGEAKVWELKTGKCLLTLKDDAHSIRSVSYSPDGKLIASVSKGPYSSVRIWNADTGKCLQILTGHSDDLKCVAFGLDGKLLAAPSLDNSVYIWNTHTGELVVALRGHTKGVWSIAFSPNGKMLASGSLDNSIIIWSIPEEKTKANTQKQQVKLDEEQQEQSGEEQQKPPTKDSSSK